MSIILPKRPGVFRYSAWDAIPVAFGIVHLLYVIGMFLTFTYLKLRWEVKVPLLAAMGIAYAYSISWNINGISHNFIHNRYFNSPILNRAMSLLISIDCCFSQVIYDYIHRRHHIGNSDKQDDKGQTIDLISIYRFGKHGAAEKRLEVHLRQLLSRGAAYSGSRDSPPRPRRGALGICGDGPHRLDARRRVLPQLEVHALLHSVLVLRTLHVLPQWLFRALRRQPRRSHGLGREQLSQAVQLGLVQQRVSRRTPLPSAGTLDADEAVARADRAGATGGRRTVIKPPHAFGFLDENLCDEPLVPVKWGESNRVLEPSA